MSISADAEKKRWMASSFYFERKIGLEHHTLYIYTLIVAVLPIMFDMSIVTITNIFPGYYFMNVTWLCMQYHDFRNVILKHGERINFIFQIEDYMLLYDKYYYLYRYFCKGYL